MNWKSVFKEERECIICLFWILLFIQVKHTQSRKSQLILQGLLWKNITLPIPLSGSQSLSTSFADASSINL